MIDPHGDPVIKRVALFLFIIGSLIAILAHHSAGFQSPETQMNGVW